jgi:hypothetical protein
MYGPDVGLGVGVGVSVGVIVGVGVTVGVGLPGTKSHGPPSYGRSFQLPIGIIT